MDNLRSGVFRGGKGKKRLPNKRGEGPPDQRMGHGLFLFYGLSLRRYTVFDCFNVVSLSPVNGGLLIKNTCPVTENTLEVRKSLRVYFLHWALNMKEL